MDIYNPLLRGGFSRRVLGGGGGDAVRQGQLTSGRLCCSLNLGHHHRLSSPESLPHLLIAVTYSTKQLLGMAVFKG